MPGLLDKLQPTPYRYQEQDDFFAKPVHRPYNFVENAIDNYRVKNRENREYLLYEKNMDAEKHTETVGATKLTRDETSVLGDASQVQNATVSNGFLAMENSNPMMRFAEEIYEGLNHPPSFSANISVPNENNIADMDQHTYATIHATIYNKTENRMVRYRFGVGLHLTGLEHDWGGSAPMVARKECTYDDLHKAFAYITTFQYKRNTSWRLFSTNCNNFVRELAEIIGMNDIASLMRTTSCVQTYRNMSKAAIEQAKNGKHRGIQFFSEEDLDENNKAMESYKFYDSNVRYSKTVADMQYVGGSMIFPQLIDNFSDALMQVHAGSCGYSSMSDYNTASIKYKAHPWYPQFWGKKKKFEKAKLMDKLFSPVMDARFDAIDLFEKSRQQFVEFTADARRKDRPVSEIEEDLRHMRGLAMRDAYSIVEDSLNVVMTTMPDDKLSQPYRHFILRCKGALRGAESAASVTENAMIASSPIEHMDTIHADAFREMSDYSALQNSLFDQNRMQYYEGDLASYILTMSMNPTGLFRLGYTFLKSLGSINGLFAVIKDKVDMNKRASKPEEIFSADIRDVISPINQLGLAIEYIDDVNSPTHAFLTKFLAANGPMVKNPEIVAWTLIHAALECIHTLWTQSYKRAKSSLSSFILPKGDRISKVLIEFQTAHMASAAMDGMNGEATKMNPDSAGALYSPSMDESEEDVKLLVDNTMGVIDSMQDRLTAIIRNIIPQDQLDNQPAQQNEQADHAQNQE